MPLFGAKKGKLHSANEMQILRSKQIESLRKANLSVEEKVRDSEYHVTFQVAGTFMRLIITLPTHFPQDKPIIKVQPQVEDPWVDPSQEMKITGCPNINNFTVHSSLAACVQAIQEHFLQNPPIILPNRAYPSMFPVATNIFNNYPAMPATSLVTSTSEAEPRVTCNQPPDLQTECNNGDSTLDIMKFFPDLKKKSHMDLLEMVNEEDKVLEIIQNLPRVQQLVQERDKIACQCTQLAKENLDKKPIVEDLKQGVREKTCQFEAVRRHYEENQTRQLLLMEQFHPTIIQNNLKVAILEADEESEIVVGDFMGKKIDVDEFIAQFLDKRALYHSRRAKEEKLNRFIMDGERF